MSINYAILGILSSKPQSGYDIKKIIQDLPFMPWSGNNNQVYKALTELLKESYVTNEVFYKEDSPSKKVYTVTDKGLQELKNWILSEPELPEYKKMILVRLAWCEQIPCNEIDLLLANYEDLTKIQLLMQKEYKRKNMSLPKKSEREKVVWDSIYENIISSYENELNWAQKTRANLSVFYTNENSNDFDEKNKLCSDITENQFADKKIIKINGHNIAIVYSSNPIISNAQTAIDFFATISYYDDCDRIIINKQSLVEDFFYLNTGIAGEILQKFATYSKKLAVVGDFSGYASNALKDFIYECNNGDNIFFVDDENTAIKMLSNVI